MITFQLYSHNPNLLGIQFTAYNYINCMIGRHSIRFRLRPTLFNIIECGVNS